jgi:hypothetical protein
VLDQGETTCCYARSEKHWITDPQGVAWEHFHTLGSIPVFNEATAASGVAPACCAASAQQAASAAERAQASGCCGAAPTGPRAPVADRPTGSCC